MDGVSERNKRKVRLFVEAVWNEGRLELIDDLIADDYVGHVPCLDAECSGPQACAGSCRAAGAPFPTCT